jgi:5'(3')-deoxyribonucleotidase
MNKIVAIDQDCTIADTYQSLILRYNQRFGTDYDPDNWLSYFGDHTITEPGITYENFHTIMAEDGFFRNLAPIRGAKAGLQRLRAAGFDLIIVSRPYRTSKHPYLDKVKWIEEHFPYIDTVTNFIATGGKKYVQADVLIDDHMPFCREYKEHNPDALIASLEYPWTDKSLVEITGQNWYSLSCNIIEKLKEDEIPFG